MRPVRPETSGQSASTMPSAGSQLGCATAVNGMANNAKTINARLTAASSGRRRIGARAVLAERRRVPGDMALAEGAVGLAVPDLDDAVLQHVAEGQRGRA